MKARTSKQENTKKPKRFLVAMRLGDTPVPIPNTMVKTQAADGTMLETIWESRWLPDYLKTTRKSVIYRYGHILVGGEQNEACEQGCVNPYQQGSAVIYNWF